MIIMMTTGGLPLPRKLTLTTERALQSDLSTLKSYTVTIQRSHCNHGSQLIIQNINCHFMNQEIGAMGASRGLSVFTEPGNNELFNT